MSRTTANSGATEDPNYKMPNHDAHTISNNSKPLLFYKLMVASIVHDDKLKIPGKVVKKIEQELSIVVTMYVPDGRKWNMKLRKDGSKCWFGDGWVEFMKYYNVRVGYLMVFRYKGDSMFIVNIFNLSNAEIQYFPGTGGGGETREEKQCLLSKGNQFGNVNKQKKFDSVAVQEDNLYVLALQAKGNKAEIEGNKKLDSAQVSVDKLYSVTSGKESANDDTQKMAYLTPQGFAAGDSHTQNMSDIISGFLQSKLAELRAEVLSQVKNTKGGLEEIQQEKQCSLNQIDTLGTDTAMNRLVAEMIGQGNQSSMNKNKESVIDITLTKSGYRNIEDENLCSVTCRTETSNNDTQKHSDVPPPGFVKPSQQTPGNDKGPSSLGGVENEIKPSGGTGSPSSFLLVKDVTPGYYRANIMSLEKKKPRVRKPKIPPPSKSDNDHSGIVADTGTLNSLGKIEKTSVMHLSVKAINVPTPVSLTTATRSIAISHMGTNADGDNKKCPDPDTLYSASATQLPKMMMNIQPAITPNLHTPVKRRREENIADLLNNTVPINVSAGQKVDISQPSVLDFTLEKTGKEQKRQKTIQLSAISKPPINPYCMVPMRVSYVQKKGLLNVPFHFASKYLPETSCYATLQNEEGKQWTVRLLLSSRRHAKFSQGWYKFATDNYLKEGDVCVFELLDSAKPLLNVSFIRSPKVPTPADSEVLKL